MGTCEGQSLLGEHKAVELLGGCFLLSSHKPTSTLVNHKSFPLGHGSEPKALHLLPTFCKLWEFTFCKFNKIDTLSMY